MALRQRLFVAIEQSLSVEGHCKSYEGTFGIVLPNYFEEKHGPKRWAVTLDCYVIGPHRHYVWEGETLDEAVAKAEAEVGGWLSEHEAWWTAEGRSLAVSA